MKNIFTLCLLLVFTIACGGSDDPATPNTNPASNQTSSDTSNSESAETSDETQETNTASDETADSLDGSNAEETEAISDETNIDTIDWASDISSTCSMFAIKCSDLFQKIGYEIDAFLDFCPVSFSFALKSYTQEFQTLLNNVNSETENSCNESFDFLDTLTIPAEE